MYDCMCGRVFRCPFSSYLFTRECSVCCAWIIFRGRANFHEWSLSPGTSNCSWTSCREGCTKELYDCTQIRVNYKLPDNTSEGSNGEGGAVGDVEDDEENKRMPRYERSLGEYIEDLNKNFAVDDENGLPKSFPTGTKWYHWGLEITFHPTSIWIRIPPIFVFERAWLYKR